MEINFQTEVSPSDLICQVRELYGKTVYSHKVHEKCADNYKSILDRVKICQIILSALTTGSFLLAIFGDGKTGTIIGAAISTILFGLNLYFKDYDLGELIQKHIWTASKLWGIRENILSLLTDLNSGSVSINKARKKRNNLIDRLEEIYSHSPRTNKHAYKLAQVALNLNDEMTFSDEEIDKLLPKALKISIRKDENGSD